VLSASVGWFLNWRTPLAMLARDIAFPGIWAYAFVGGEVSWRGNAMKISTDGANKLNDARPAAPAQVGHDGR
jgi:ceramide glucosyltransferase